MLDRLVKTLENKYFVLVIFAMCFVGWLFDCMLAVAIVMTISCSAILILCKDIRNFLASILYVPFSLADLEKENHWTLYIICIAIIVLCLAYNIIFKMLIKRRGSIEKGKMFWPFIATMIAIMIGGAFVNYNFLVSLIIAGIFFVCYLFYFIAINSKEKLSEYINFYFIAGSILIVIDFIVEFFIRGNSSLVWLGAQNVNTTSLCLILGICAVMNVGYKTKWDWLSVVVADIFTLFIVLTQCRTAIGLSIIVDIILFIKLLIDSKKRLYVILSIALILVLFGIFYLIFKQTIDAIIDRFTLKTFLNGREELWPWCFEIFKSHPILGYGFMATEDVPTVRNVVGTLILAHNTPLQWLVSVGVVGSIAFIYFYIEKYIVVFNSIGKEKFFNIVGIIAIAISGFVDQAATMDFFLVASVFMLVAICEVNKKENIKVK